MAGVSVAIIRNRRITVMSELPTLVHDLALILGVAGITTLVFKRLRQPLILGYVVAGYIVGPHMPYTFTVADTANIHIWADIGVMFLLFSLGLDFSFKKIIKTGVAPIITTCTIVFCMMVLGMVMGHAFGWSRMDCVFLGGMLAMSSTTIIYKAFGDMGLRQQQFAKPVMSVLILEDILAIVMMVMLSAIAVGKNPDGGQMIGSIARIAFFLVLWFVVGIFVVPIFLRSVRRLINDETLLVVSVGLCCLMAVLSTTAGFSSAFGAFVMGSILAETVEADRIERLVAPVKDLFGAVFFVSVGMLVDPKIIVEYAVPIIVLVMTIIVGQTLFGTFAFVLGGQTLRSAMRCGFSMAQIGEFSFIIASLGLSLGVIGHFLYPVVVAVSVITTFLTPYMIRAAVPCYNWTVRVMPDSWIAMLNNLTLSRPAKTGNSKWKVLLLDMARNTFVYSILSMATVVLMLRAFLPFVRSILPHWWANAVCGLLTVVAMAPFLRAIIMKKNHSEEFKSLWSESRVNRLPLLFTVLVRMVIATAFIFYVCNYLTRFANAFMLSIAVGAVMLIVVSRSMKRRSIRLERMFEQNLRSRDIEAQVLGTKKPLYEGRLLDRDIHIGDFVIPEGSSWAGRRLRDLRIGSRFGVMVSSILRGRWRINIPGGDSVFFPGDRVQAIGSDNQLAVFQTAVDSEVMADDPGIESREMKLRRVMFGHGSCFVGKTLGESGIREQFGCMVVGLEEGRENLTTIHPSYRFREGDILWIVGEEKNIDKIEAFSGD